MKRGCLLAAAVVLCSGVVFAQSTSPLLSEKIMPGMAILSDRSYDGSSLWGYIDGGADVYLEYGFVSLRALKTEVDSVRYQIDIYHMANPESAFGIFSISNYTCANSDSVVYPHCFSRYQAQIACDSFYISIVNDKGTPEAARKGVLIARTLAMQIAPVTRTLPGLFSLKDFAPFQSKVKFIKGRLGIQNGYASWDGLFDTVDHYALYLLSLETNNGDLAVAHIRFGDARERESFLSHSGFTSTGSDRLQAKEPNGTLRYAWKTANVSVIMLEGKSDPAGTTKCIHAIDEYLGRQSGN